MGIYLYLNGSQAGPFSEQQIRGMLESGTIKPDDFVWREGLARWQPLDQVISLSPPPADPVPAAQAPVGEPVVKRRVRISIAAILFVVAALGFRCWVYFVVMGVKDPMLSQMFLFMGSCLRDVVLVPALLAAAAWRVCRKSQWLDRAVNGVFCLAICVLGFVMWHGAQPAAGAQKLAQAQREIDSEMRRDLKDPGKGLAVAQQEFDRYSQQLGNAANDLQGNDKLEAEARRNYSKLFSVQLQKYSQAFQALNEAGFIQPKGINTRDDLQHRRELARAFADANGQLADFYRNSRDTLRGELQKENLSSAFIESELKDFDRTANVDAALQMRQLDAELVEQAGKIFDIYDKQWGQWSVDAQGAILFKDSAAYVDYNNALNAIKQITGRQKAVQQQTLQRSRAAGNPQ